MKAEEPDGLLKAVLDEDAAFRHATLRQTVALARARRQKRFAGRALAITAILAGAAWLLLPPPPAPESKPAASALAVRIVHTTPLGLGETVRTRDVLFARVATVPADLAVVRSHAETVVRIAPGGDAPKVNYLDDRQLLAAFPDRHPVLIAPGTPDAQLVFY